MKIILERDRDGFTLIELLVVMGIIGVLFGLLLPSISRVAENARQTECLSKLRQLGLAFSLYHETYGCFPENNVAVSEWSPFTRILPYCEEEDLFGKFDLAQSIPLGWGPTGIFVGPIEKSLKKLKCPNQPQAVGSWFEDLSWMGLDPNVDGPGGYFTTGAITYAVSGGPSRTGSSILGGAMPLNVSSPQPATLQDIHDGLSHTFLLGELREGTFAHAGFVDFGSTAASTTASTYRPMSTNEQPGTDDLVFGSRHLNEGVTFVMADGSTRIILAFVAMPVLKALSTRSAAD